MSRLIAPLLIGVAGAAILIALGVWQIQRLAWKEAVLAEIDAKIAGPVAPLPNVISPTEQKYQPVALTGEIGPAELQVLVSVKQRGAGWRIIAPFSTDDGRRILIDRGFVPDARRADQRVTGPAQIIGNLHWPDDRNGSTPDNDTATNTWFARDIPAMAEALQTEPLLVIVRSADPAAPGLTALPVDTAGIPNDHLQYAVTWFSLAAIWLAMSGAWLWRTNREA